MERVIDTHLTYSLTNASISCSVSGPRSRTTSQPCESSKSWCDGTDNSAMLDAIASNPDRYRGVCNAAESFTGEYFEELHAGGIRGVRFNFVKHLGGAPDLDKLRDIISRIKHLAFVSTWINSFTRGGTPPLAATEPV